LHFTKKLLTAVENVVDFPAIQFKNSPDGGILDLIKEGETDYFGNSGGANTQNWGQAGGAFDF
jgi:hypothetical protein